MSLALIAGCARKDAPEPAGTVVLSNAEDSAALRTPPANLPPEADAFRKAEQAARNGNR